MPTNISSEAVTRGIRVSVRARFSEQNSDPQARQWVFLYTITIRNEGTSRVQLLTRHWIITDANGEIEEVKGPGVVGKQPILEPGQGFEYTSACPLKTPFGSMHGSYQMLGPNNDTFDVQIAGFALRMPGTMQ